MFIKPNIQLFAEGNTDPTNGGNNANQDGGNGSEPKTYTQDELDKIVNERTGRATKSALTSFFKQKGLTEDEANSAMASYLENKAKNTPDISALQNNLTAEKSARLQAEINQSATLEAIKQGVDVKSIPYVLKMADFKDCTDEKGAINAEKLTNAIKTVLDDIPALKGAQQNSNSGVLKIGGDGGNQTETTEDALRGIFGIKK
jgi:hypothetical protein